MMSFIFKLNAKFAIILPIEIAPIKSKVFISAIICFPSSLAPINKIEKANSVLKIISICSDTSS